MMEKILVIVATVVILAGIIAPAAVFSCQDYLVILEGEVNFAYLADSVGGCTKVWFVRGYELCGGEGVVLILNARHFGGEQDIAKAFAEYQPFEVFSLYVD
jgi:hypothetical protein